MKLLTILRMLIPPVSQHVRKLKENSLAEPTKEANDLLFIHTENTRG